MDGRDRHPYKRDHIGRLDPQSLARLCPGKFDEKIELRIQPIHSVDHDVDRVANVGLLHLRHAPLEREAHTEHARQRSTDVVGKHGKRVKAHAHVLRFPANMARRQRGTPNQA